MSARFQIDNDVAVDLIGRIVSVGYNMSGKLEYKVDDGKGNVAYVQESHLTPLPTPEDPK